MDRFLESHKKIASDARKSLMTGSDGHFKKIEPDLVSNGSISARSSSSNALNNSKDEKYYQFIFSF